MSRVGPKKNDMRATLKLLRKTIMTVMKGLTLKLSAMGLNSLDSSLMTSSVNSWLTTKLLKIPKVNEVTIKAVETVKYLTTNYLHGVFKNLRTPTTLNAWGIPHGQLLFNS